MPTALFDITDLQPALEQGAEIVTANDRLRRHILASWNQHQQARGLSAWRAPRLAPLNRWLENHWQQLLERGYPGCTGIIATRHQRQLIWEQIIADSPDTQGLLQPEPLAQQADAALTSLQLWRIDPKSLRDDSFINSNTQCFLNWLDAFEKRLQLRGMITPQTAQAIVGDAFADGTLPTYPILHLVGFDDLPPLHQAILEQASAQQIEHRDAGAPDNQCRRTSAPDSDSEVRAAALWALEQLQRQPEASIGIIVPDLGQRRDQIERIFCEVFEPAAALPDVPRYTLPFNFSAGVPLGNTALIHSALGLLGLLKDHWPLAHICSLMHSLFWSDADAELTLRTALTSRLRDLGKFEISGSDLRYHAQRLSEALSPEDAAPMATDLARRLQHIDEQRHRLPRSASARYWASAFTHHLTLLGWPGSRRPDSQEYQQLGLWYELLETFAGLDATGSDLTLSQALRQLAQLAGQTPFQAQTPDSPIQILGVLEGAGLRFSHCWVLGLHHRQWPPVPAPNPLLPLDLQRREQMPHATAERELTFARSLTDNYRRCATDVIVSSPHGDDQGDATPSPLIRALPETPMVELLGEHSSAFERYQQALAEAQELEAVPTANGPRFISSDKAPGGSSLFKQQAACPFNAFAQLRLGARQPDPPVAGLSPAERGSILHEVLATLWTQLRNSDTLAGTDDDTLADMIRTATAASVQTVQQRRPRELGPVYCALEQERLQRIIGRWMALERERPAFEVIATEKIDVVEFAGLKLKLIIDRIDRLPNGELLLIDYKTGASLSAKQWHSERPDEPQLPLYAVTQGTDVHAIAFAQLNPKALQWIGLGDLQSPLPGLHPPSTDWDEQLGEWQSVLEKLARDFIDGDARVDFKDATAQRYSEELLPLNRALEKPKGSEPLGIK
ncbi:PD-(D/E)XK nuclease family protein [Marinimicrobium alkaliphilum]|uniref:PD-(D/E)XK nuclease family protein n=1 Tax=Marinimicrobium alkaliphilum TaxID=2202654 RepID=UPI000DB960F1|nr:PD-(D/E)XK nuclease family protein [Marinimicrobium alkaliphilum]